MKEQRTSNIRVYFVDDQALIRESLHTLLELEPEVELVGAASSAEQALMQLDYVGVDMVLMDVGLPGMDGVEATRLLKKRHPELAVVVLTAHEDQFMGAAVEASAAAYIANSCTGKELVRTMQDALNFRRQSTD